MKEALKMSTRSNRAETKDGRKDDMVEREAGLPFCLPRIRSPVQLYCLTASLDSSEESKYFIVKSTRMLQIYQSCCVADSSDNKISN